MPDSPVSPLTRLHTSWLSESVCEMGAANREERRECQLSSRVLNPFRCLTSGPARWLHLFRTLRVAASGSGWRNLPIRRLVGFDRVVVIRRQQRLLRACMPCRACLSFHAVMYVVAVGECTRDGCDK